MAQIRSKQIADFLKTVDWSTVANTEIANASDVKAYVDQEVSALGLDANASIDSLEVALSAEIVATNTDVTALKGDIAALDVKFDSEMESHHEEHTSLIAAEKERATGVEGELSAEIVTEKNRIDAILLASDADKDSFAEIVSVINAVDLENDNALAVVIGNLNDEIASTNSDFVRVEAALAAEIAATDADVDGLKGDIVSLEAKHNKEMEVHHNEHTSLIAAEENRAIEAEKSLEKALANEIADTNSDVTSIDVRLGAVSGDLVDSVDSLEVALSAEIADTNSDVTRLEGTISELEGKHGAEMLEHHNEHLSLIKAEETRATEVEGKLSAEIVKEFERATGVEGELSAEIVTEKERIDAILLASSADKDSFAEIVTLINNVDTENDQAFASYVLSNNASVDSLEAALTAEINATNSDVTALYAAITAEETARENADDALQAALTAEINATNSDVTRIDAALAAEIAATNSDVTRIDAKDAAQDNRLDALESTILQDKEMLVESFVGGGFEYTLGKQVQDDNKFLVSAFVNGHNVTIGSVVGNVVTFVNPGYDIDKKDVVTITYQA